MNRINEKMKNIGLFAISLSNSVDLNISSNLSFFSISLLKKYLPKILLINTKVIVTHEKFKKNCQENPCSIYSLTKFILKSVERTERETSNAEFMKNLLNDYWFQRKTF